MTYGISNAQGDVFTVYAYQIPINQEYIEILK